MKNKILIICAAVAIAISVYSFSVDVENLKLMNVSFTNLSEDGKVIFKQNLVKGLKQDSLFIAYDWASNFQLDLFLEGRSVKNTKIPPISPPSFKSEHELANYYKQMGVFQPDLYARLEILKYGLLGRLYKKYPELTQMDDKSQAEVFASSKKPIKISRKLKRKLWASKILKGKK